MQRNTKKKTTLILALALAVVVAIGGTLAYLAAVTDEAANTFTFADNIKGGLSEPNWDPDTGLELVPGFEMRKDPMITNLSDNGIDEFTAIRVNLTDFAGAELTDAEAARLLNLITVDWNTADWALADSDMENCAEQIWVYKGSIAPGEVTAPLFNTVGIKAEAEYVADFKANNPTVDEADIPDWNTEYAWLASIVMEHTESCYDFGAHDDAECTVSYRHHVNCPVSGEADEATTPGAGTITGSNSPDDDIVCDCTPAEEHEEDCPSLVGTVNNSCTHTADGIDGFQIVVRGAVVQANVDGMTAWNDAATIANLTTLFTNNPYVAP